MSGIGLAFGVMISVAFVLLLLAVLLVGANDGVVLRHMVVLVIVGLVLAGIGAIGITVLGAIWLVGVW